MEPENDAISMNQKPHGTGTVDIGSGVSHNGSVAMESQGKTAGLETAQGAVEQWDSYNCKVLSVDQFLIALASHLMCRTGPAYS